MVKTTTQFATWKEIRIWELQKCLVFSKSLAIKSKISGIWAFNSLIMMANFLQFNLTKNHNFLMALFYQDLPQIFASCHSLVKNPKGSSLGSLAMFSCQSTTQSSTWLRMMSSNSPIFKSDLPMQIHQTSLEKKFSKRLEIWKMEGAHQDSGQLLSAFVSALEWLLDTLGINTLDRASSISTSLTTTDCNTMDFFFPMGLPLPSSPNLTKPRSIQEISWLHKKPPSR